jgi:hypothetical protein
MNQVWTDNYNETITIIIKNLTINIPTKGGKYYIKKII